MTEGGSAAQEGCTIMNNYYHYTESGLENVYLDGGFQLADGRLVIKDIDGLHKVIGRALISSKKNLTGREIRFLRQEMLMSQSTLAKLLEVSEQAVARWEKGKSGLPKPAEALIRLLYREFIGENGKSGIREKLERIAALEDEIDGDKVTVKKKHIGWQVAA